MWTEVILAAVRHGATFFGGILGARGLATQSETEAALGAAVTLAGFAWSVYRKWQRAK